jgi:outer membrane protein assembly factor BamB
MRPRLVAALISVWSVGCGVRTSTVERFVAPESAVSVRWRRHLTEEPLIEYKPQEFAAAESDGRRVYVGSSAGVFYAFSARDGSMLWHKTLDGAIGGHPRIGRDEGLVYIGTQNGTLYALDRRTGKEAWHYAVKGPVDSQPTLVDGMLYFTTGENRIYALDARTGVWRWQYDRESPDGFTVRGYGSPLVEKGRVYVGFSDGYLACLQAGSGDVIWARSLGGDATRFMDVDSTPILDDGLLYVSSYTGGAYALDPKDGSVAWRYAVEGAGTVVPKGDLVFFASPVSGLHAVDRQGRLVWRQSLGTDGELSAPLVVNGLVMVSSAQRGTFVADAASGQLKTCIRPGHGVTSAPTTDGRQVYLLSNGGYLYALAL